MAKNTVFDKGNKLAYSEGDWQKVEHLTTKLLERYHKNKDFPEKSKGTLSLKERKWTVVEENDSEKGLARKKKRVGTEEGVVKHVLWYPITYSKDLEDIIKLF
ncbi:hypothetical protein TNIN_156581 [Trichonephila inaurata madagascariensis]|uniref:Uncharacterized protein n=1 Tax=Trichonephila inaurata madagascariensis TaxID=2747483 RepID=A0A8X6XJS7_9ARAC|nr:hypothetical protein TNIN_156581 [Trichonephila inaurata madagascariensis]